MLCKMSVFSLLMLSIFAPLHSQITSYTENNVVNCDNGYYIRTDFPDNIIGFNVTETEKLEYNGALLTAISNLLNTPLSMLSQEDATLIKFCNSKVVVATIDSYHTRPAKMDQRHGTIKITFHFFNAASDEKPYNSVTLVAEGDRHWGNSTPLENSIIEITKKIRTIAR